MSSIVYHSYKFEMDTEKKRQRRRDDVRQTESRNARSERLVVVPTELLTNREWLPGELDQNFKGPVGFRCEISDLLRHAITAHMQFNVLRAYSTIEQRTVIILCHHCYIRHACHMAETLEMVRNGNCNISFIFCAQCYPRILCVSKNMDTHCGRRSHNSVGTGE